MSFFFFNDTATTEIYTLSLHDALPICHKLCPYVQRAVIALTEKGVAFERIDIDLANKPDRSEEHTSELQSRQYLVCRLLLEKKDRLAEELHKAAVLFHHIVLQHLDTEF